MELNILTPRAQRNGEWAETSGWANENRGLSKDSSFPFDSDVLRTLFVNKRRG